MENEETFWGRVNSLIRLRNTTQKALSIKCGFNERRIQNLSGGDRLPDCIEAVLIAKNLGTTVEYLVTGELTDSATELNELKKKLLEFVQSVL
ncbi:MAG: hypothetical protein J6S85_19970 [Methanobrevibacter sp.]|nr:hypothetical protein [Methanobrevibacter sp.]